MNSDRLYLANVDRHPYPTRRPSQRAARTVERLLLVLAVVTVAAMIGGVL